MAGSTAVAAIGAIAFFHGPIRQALFGPPAAADMILLSGNIEAHESILSFTQVQAPIVDLPFDEGKVVTAGTVLARVDDRIYQRQVDIDQTNLNVAIAQVSVSESSLEAARHALASDTFDLAEKQKEYARAESLARSDAVSQQTRDLALTAQQQSAAALARDQAMVAVAQANVRLAQENVAAAQARIMLDRTTLSFAELKAPFTGVIAVRAAELGQLAAPGVAIFTLDDLDHIWLRAYINGPDIGRVRLGESVTVTTDSYPGKVYEGRISFISSQAEFTPKTVETHAERITQVYRVRIDIDNPSHELLPGMPADATVRMVAPGQ
ncbi:efflux RND transporter periplasmic adaptor subunit [Rhizobium sp. BK376]|uniref:HlyD family secretion protein n=1 Tax=Rhizobium sp. BK376 TaxID=2512149 RepID=UPI001A9D3BF0|nr:efflux RND transporter periplasmic adaptor subunit [Rhizobium sp. BK376]